MSLDNSHKIFFELLKAGLFPVHGEGVMVHDSLFKNLDWGLVYQLAQEQSVQGIVLSGLEELKAKGIELSVPKVLLLQWIGEVQVIEQRNKEMNVFLASLSEKLKAEHIHALLVKGQGIAQCYEKPLWRACGDVDFLLNKENYDNGIMFLSGIAQKVHEENDFDEHFSVILDGWDVELHGSMRSMLPEKTDTFIDEIQKEVFEKKRCRVWNNNGTEILLPNPDDDVIFVFTHILKHFFHYGIGLRQVCDWCRLLYCYREELDFRLLESRLCMMGLMSEWKVFYNLASRYLGMPDLDSRLTCVESATSRHSSNKFGSAHDSIADFMVCDSRFDKKADRVLAFILETGNFGHNRDNSYYNNTNAVVRGLMSLWRHTCDSFKHSFIFPVDSVRIWCRMFMFGICDAMKGK